jgi:hypothetical protein
VSAPVAAATAAGRPRAGERTARGGRNRAGVDCKKRSRAVVVTRPGAVQHRAENVTARVWRRGSGFFDG